LTGTVQRLQQSLAPQITDPHLPIGGEDPGQRLVHEHAHFTGITNMLRGFGFYNLLRPLVVGIVHGLAGSAAVALLVMTTIRDPWVSTAYLLLFGLGTIAGMVLITAVISTPFIHTAKRFARLNRAITVAAGVISLAFGLFVAYQIGIVQGLFSAHPRWVPR
jgi:high-affinity nickel-transport protein